MSDLQFSTTKDYLKLAYDFEVTLVRAASTFISDYSIPLEYTATGYTPMVTGEYTDENDNTFPCKTAIYTFTLPTGFSDVVVVIFTNGSNVIFNVVGDPSDPVARTVTVKGYVFMQSNEDVADD